MGIDVSESAVICSHIGNPDMSLSTCNCCKESADPNYKRCLTQRIAPILFAGAPVETAPLDAIPIR